MVVIPAIDLKDGRCVRLQQGDLHRETVYSGDAPGMALQWQAQGAELLHVVDLNGAVAGRPANASEIEAILKSVSVPVQVGGGIRNIDSVKRYLGAGASRVVLGTAALQDRTFLEQACAEFPGCILLGLDARGDRVATRGWTTLSETTPGDLLATLSSYPLSGVIYTDISKDGMLEGPNLAALRDVLGRSPFPLIASGGITRVEDIQAIKGLGPRIMGAIVGKALYDGKLDFGAARKAAA